MNVLSPANAGASSSGSSAPLPFWNALQTGLTLDGSDNVIQGGGGNLFAWTNRRIKNAGDYFEVTASADFATTFQMFLQNSNSMVTTAYADFLTSSYYIAGANTGFSITPGDVLRFQATSATTVDLKKNGSVLGTLTHSETNGFIFGLYTGNIADGHTILKPVWNGTAGI